VPLAAVALVVPIGALAAGTAAQPVPGATYTGIVAGKASITFTVSSDGTLVDSYQAVALHGTDKNGNGCLVNAAGDRGVWSGGPITGNAFSYAIGSQFNLSGRFTGAQSASGTISVDNPPTYASGGVTVSTGCSTGTLAWTATTTAKPPPNGGGNGNGQGNGNPAGGAGHTSITVRVSLKRLSGAKLSGSLKASSRTCTAHRVVYLWKGRKRVRAGRATGRGSFDFRVSESLRNKPVRATVTVLNAKTLTCAAASSKFIKG
jgi:hypothetical protein